MTTSRHFALTGSLLLAVARLASAGDVLLKNDSLTDGSQAALQGGFVEGEIGAAVLAAPSPSQYPLTLKDIQVFVDKTAASAPTSMTVQLYVWTTSTLAGTSPTPASAVYVSPQLSFTEGAFNQWDVSSAGIVVTGPFTVGCKVVDNTFISLFQGNQPNLVTDTNGCQGSKNFVYAKQAGGNFLWQGLCGFGVSGDLAIRATAQTGGADGQFIDLGGALTGSFNPSLSGSGSLADGGAFTLDAVNLPPAVTATLFVGFNPLFADFKGGTLGTTPDLLLVLGTGTGSLALPGGLPAGTPGNLSFYLQLWAPDAGGPKGASATNTLQCVTPP
jgi:hypothetical protein